MGARSEPMVETTMMRPIALAEDNGPQAGGMGVRSKPMVEASNVVNAPLVKDIGSQAGGMGARSPSRSPNPGGMGARSEPMVEATMMRPIALAEDNGPQAGGMGVRSKPMVEASNPGPGPQRARLPGGRLHLQHGPIDLIIKAWGDEVAIEHAYQMAERRFRTILHELVAELPLLRRPVSAQRPPAGTTARRMWQAALSFAPRFITPMAAVAGAVADEIASVMASAGGLDKFFVNDGGDIALWFGVADQELWIGIVPDALRHRFAPWVPAAVRIRPADGIGGVATSGWQGRSHSLGIADAVTVLAENAARADAAATLIANAVDLDSSAVRRVPASELDPDSDLGDRLVTVAVGRLSDAECSAALASGVLLAQEYVSRGLIRGAFLFLQGRYAAVGNSRLSLST